MNKMARPKKEQKSETNPEAEPDQVIEVVEEVIQDLENAMAGMDLAIAKLKEQSQVAIVGAICLSQSISLIL